jgi:hypothetical protein
MNVNKEHRDINSLYVFYTTVFNMSVVLWRWEIGIPGENNQLAASQRQNLSHKTILTTWQLILPNSETKDGIYRKNQQNQS